MIVEPLLSPSMVNARIYGVDYVVVVSAEKGSVRMSDVRHTYLHYVIDPLLYARSNAIDREQPILKEIRDAPLDFRYRSRSFAADDRVPDQGNRGAHDGHGSGYLQDSWQRRSLAICLATSTSGSSRLTKLKRCAGRWCSTI